MTQQDQTNREAHLTSATELVNHYLQLVPGPLLSFQAFAYSTLATIYRFRGEQETGNKYSDQAASIDPYCSKATGMPPNLLYCPPEEVNIQYSSFFMPF